MRNPLRRQAATPTSRVDIESMTPVRHRYDISTTDFTDSRGAEHTSYAVLSYGTTAQDAADRALAIIAARYAPTDPPTVTAIRCDMGCTDSATTCLPT